MGVDRRILGWPQLFFTGVAGISENLRRLSGQGFRRLLARSTHHPVIAAAGALTHSTSVVAFILSGMTASGLHPLFSPKEELKLSSA